MTMAADLSAASDAAIAAAMTAALSAATWVPQGGSPEPAFQAVRTFDSLDLARAFEEVLIASTNRIAFVVLGGASWEDGNATVSRLVATRSKTASVIVSDRVVGRREEAILGSASTPGCAGLKDVALRALVGSIGTSPKVEIRPTSEDLLFVERLEDTAKTLPGRAAYIIEFNVRGGSITADLTPGPRL